jgi:O-antigen/teichoic acid export membrane protein
MKHALTWGSRAGLSIIDQGLYSGANFALSMILARWMTLEEYGAFSIAYATSLLLTGIHQVFVIEPLIVIGPANYSTKLPAYLQRALILHFIITGLLAGAGAITSLFFSHSLSQAIFFMSLTLLVVPLLNVVRRIFYMDARSGFSACISGSYFVALMLWVFGMHLTRIETATAAFVGMGSASLLASVFGLKLARLGLSNPVEPGPALAKVWEEHWELCKWLFPSALLYPLLVHVQTFLTGAYLGLAAAGMLRVLQNPILPILQVITALMSLIIPNLARSYAEGDRRGVYRRGFQFTAVLTAFALAFELALVLSGSLWDRVLYKGQYTAVEWLMPIVGIIPVFTAIAQGGSVILRAVQKSGLISIANVAGGLSGVLTTVLFIHWWGLPGSVYSLIAAQVVTAFVTLIVIAWLARTTTASLKVEEVTLA